MDAQFEGLAPWPIDSGIIECEATQLGTVDLHNSCDVLRLAVDFSPDSLSLWLHFQTIETTEKFALMFGDVDQIAVVPHESSEGDGQVFHGIDHYLTGPADPACFEIDLDFLSIKFRSCSVRFLAA